MGKGPNDKKSQGQARKEEQAAQKALAEARAREAAEAASWEEGAKKQNSKKQDAEEKKAAKAERKAAADAELEMEIQEMSKGKKGTGVNKARAGTSSSKLTAAQVAANLEAEKSAEKRAKKREEKSKVNDYMGSLEANSNTLDAVDAHDIDEALAALDMSNDRGVDKVNLKAAFEAFSEAEMVRVRQEKPGLKLSQYRELVWKSWQKSPSNPLVQRA